MNCKPSKVSMRNETAKWFVCKTCSNGCKRTRRNSVDACPNSFSTVTKRSFSRRNHRVFCSEKDLLQEVQKCRRTTKAPTPTASGASASKKLSLPARLDLHLKNVEDERDMFKNECEILQKLLSERARSGSSPNGSRIRARSVSPSPAQRSTVRRDMATSPVMSLSRRSASNGSVSPTRCTVCGINRHRASPTKVKRRATKTTTTGIEECRLGSIVVWNTIESSGRRTRSIPTRTESIQTINERQSNVLFSASERSMD